MCAKSKWTVMQGQKRDKNVKNWFKMAKKFQNTWLKAT